MAAETWVTRLVDLYHEWAIRITAIVSLLAYVLLIRLVETRRRCNTSPWKTFFLWLVYQTLDKAGSYAIANLSLDTTGETQAADNEQLLIAFWAPFLLLHLAGPDNVGAYSLDDDKLSWRKLFDSLGKVTGAVYIVYTKILIAHKGLLSVASFVMICVGILRYLEMAVTLLLSRRSKAWGSSDKDPPASALPIDSSCRGNEGTRRMAQGQWQCCGYRALFDSSVEMNSPLLETSKKIFDLGWKEMCEVVEIEASLMFDMLYTNTKVPVVYSIRGYLLRIISPLATFSTAILFFMYPKDSVELPDLIITYMVLALSLLLDLLWLVMALASTWMYAFLASRPGTWLHHKVLGKWLVVLSPRHRSRSVAACWHGSNKTKDVVGDHWEVRFAAGLRLYPWARGWNCLETVIGQEDVGNQFRTAKCSSQLPLDDKELVLETLKQRLCGTSEYRP